MSEIDVALRGLKKKHEERTWEEKFALQKLLSDIPDIRDSFATAQESNPELNQPAYFDYLASRLSHEFYQKGECICHKGDAGKFMLIVLSGKAAIALPKGPDALEILKEKIDTHCDQIIKKSLSKEALFEQSKEAVERLLGGKDKLLRLGAETSKNKQLSLKSLVALANYQAIGYSETDLKVVNLGKGTEYFEEGVIKYFTVAFKNKGDVFGEQALIHNQTRNATVYAFEDIHAACLSKAIFQQIFKSKIEDEKKKFSFFHERFKNVSQAGITKLVNYFSKKTFSMSNVIFKANQPITAIYVVSEGTVNTFKTNEVEQHQSLRPVQAKANELHKVRSRCIQTPLSSLQSGEFFGVDDLLRGQPHSYTAICASASAEVFMISIENFRKIEHSTERYFVDALREKMKLKTSWYNSQNEKSKKIKTDFDNCVYKAAENQIKQRQASPPKIKKVDNPQFNVPKESSDESYDIYSIIKNRNEKASSSSRKGGLSLLKKSDQNGQSCSISHFGLQNSLTKSSSMASRNENGSSPDSRARMGSTQQHPSPHEAVSQKVKNALQIIEANKRLSAIRVFEPNQIFFSQDKQTGRNSSPFTKDPSGSSTMGRTQTEARILDHFPTGNFTLTSGFQAKNTIYSKDEVRNPSSLARPITCCMLNMSIAPETLGSSSSHFRTLSTMRVMQSFDKVAMEPLKRASEQKSNKRISSLSFSPSKKRAIKGKVSIEANDQQITSSFLSTQKISSSPRQKNFRMRQIINDPAKRNFFGQDDPK